MSEPQLRDYQLDVVGRARARIREGKRRVIIQAATGAGKGVMAAHLLSACADKGKRAVFLVHRRRLIDQMIENCLDYGHRPGLIMAGYPRTPSLPIQLASRDTLFSRAVTNEWMDLPDADLVILDEAHNCGARLEHLLGRYRDAVLIGMTATPVYSGGRGMGCPSGPYQALECTVPTSRLVEEGWLSPVKCFSPEGAVKAKKGG